MAATLDLSVSNHYTAPSRNLGQVKKGIILKGQMEDGVTGVTGVTVLYICNLESFVKS